MPPPGRSTSRRQTSGGSRTAAATAPGPVASSAETTNPSPPVSSTAELSLLTGAVARPDVEGRDRPLGVRGDVRAQVLVEIVAQHEGAVFTDADVVSRDVEGVLVRAAEHEFVVERVLNDVLLAQERDCLEPVDAREEVVLDRAAHRQVLTQR